MDVVSAFLNGELKEDMKQPPGYVQSGKENVVCKLTPRCWNQKLCDHLKVEQTLVFLSKMKAVL